MKAKKKGGSKAPKNWPFELGFKGKQTTRSAGKSKLCSKVSAPGKKGK